MIKLATELLGASDQLEDLDARIAVQSIKLDSSKATLERAVLVREVAELALTEYKKEIFPGEKASLEAELKQARSELDSARPRIEIAKDRSAQFAKISQGSTSDIAKELRLNAGVVVAQLEVKKAEFAVEQAESKLKVLLGYDNPKRLKELSADVEKAKADELAQRATLQIEQSRTKQFQALSKEQAPIARESRVRPLADRQAIEFLDRAILIEEMLRARLDQLAKLRDPDPRLQNEIRNLAKQLKVLVDQAEIARSAMLLNRLKPEVKKAANR
jgi:hypothetical protein